MVPYVTRSSYNTPLLTYVHIFLYTLFVCTQNLRGLYAKQGPNPILWQIVTSQGLYRKEPTVTYFIGPCKKYL